MSSKVICVTYRNEYSADKNSYRDLMIGVEYGVVGCGSKGLNACKEGDYVIINATKDKVKHVVIGRLTEQLESCDKWKREGGLEWPYNFKYKQVTEIFQLDDALNNEIIHFCELNKLKRNNLFNSRFCSNKLQLVVDMLIKKYSINL
jgi:hypothetical protein